MLRAVAIIVCVLGMVWLESIRMGARQEPPLFQVGQSYLVIYGCLPPGMGLPNPCAGEIVTVKAIRSDGWLTIRDASGQAWTLNPDQIVSFTPYVPKDAKAL